MTDETEEKTAKRALLGYYESRQTSHGAILIGLILALFTLLEVAQNATKEPLAPLFVNIVSGLSLNPSLVGWFRLNILFFGIWLLVTLSIYALLRISVFSQMFINTLLVTEPQAKKLLEKNDGIERVYAGALMEIAGDMIAEKKTKLFGLDLIWFVPRGKKGDKSRTGWLVSLLIGLILTLILLFLLW